MYSVLCISTILYLLTYLVRYSTLFLQLSRRILLETLWDDMTSCELIIESSMRNEFARLRCDEQLIMAGPSTAYE